MALSQQELALQMLAQLRMLDPSVSAEVGTPERKILDTVAQALADAQIDLTQLAGALDVDAKNGAELDRFLALFGFGRQVATQATGFVTLSRVTASNLDIQIPEGTQFMAPGGSADNAENMVFQTTAPAVLQAGTLEVTVAVTAVLPGAASNVAANTITQFVGTPIYGITGVSNPLPATGGVDAEDDDQLKVRFKNTVFRNLAGTQDQFLALAASMKFTTKANVIGPVSRYREYLQVPSTPDTNGGNSTVAGEYTSALSTNPYSKHVYREVPNFVSNGQVGANTVFWREEIDWRLNTTAAEKNKGDTYRFAMDGTDLPASHINALYRPNVTFLNVYTGAADSVTAVRQGDVVLFEHSYMSTSSRNDWQHNVTNCVDVFLDGGNPTLSTAVLACPGPSTATAFVNNNVFSQSGSWKYHYDNYRLWGNPDIAPATWDSGDVPLPGGTFVPDTYLFIPLFFQPVIGVPDQIIIDDNEQACIFYKDVHYWHVYDNTDLYGTVRARNGLCWDRTRQGATQANATTYDGKALMDYASAVPFTVESYSYDQNVVDLQANLEASRQVTTDVLAHRARTRYFKLDVTLMYNAGASPASTNSQVRDALARFFQTQYFGRVVQLSDLLQVIHNVPGVDNARWTSDVPQGPDVARMYETSIDGRVITTYDADFFLMDDEIPALAEAVSTEDGVRAGNRELAALPGLLIRTRAQNTWNRS